MKAIPSVWRKRLLVLVGISSLLVASGRGGFASPNDSSDEALAAAQAWIAQIDAGDYQNSYAAGCFEFHGKLSEDQWEKGLKAFRLTYGQVISRKEVSRVVKQNGIEGLDGTCMVVTYDTSFSRLQNGYEQVILKVEDGKCRGAGYVAGPKPTDDAASGSGQLPANIDTEIQTITTKHPDQ